MICVLYPPQQTISNRLNVRVLVDLGVALFGDVPEKVGDDGILLIMRRIFVKATEHKDNNRGVVKSGRVLLR